jgi:hypothetical protein
VSGTTVTRVGFAQDLPAWAPPVAIALALASLVFLAIELRRSERSRRGLVAALSALAQVALLLAVLRPVRVSSSESSVGPRIVVLADESRSLALRDGAGTRATLRDRALESLRAGAPQARITVLGFGADKPRPTAAGAEPLDAHSDLRKAAAFLGESAEERPDALVVVSDGRLDDPPEESNDESLAGLFPGTKVHTVSTTTRVPKDASIRRVAAAGAVAHVPLPLSVEVGCDAESSRSWRGSSARTGPRPCSAPGSPRSATGRPSST